MSRKGGSGLSSLAKMQAQQQGEQQGGGDQRPTERKRLVLTSEKVKSGGRDASSGGSGMGAQYNRQVAAGPDGTRGFAMPRTKLQRFGTPRAGDAGERGCLAFCLCFVVPPRYRPHRRRLVCSAPQLSTR